MPMDFINASDITVYTAIFGNYDILRDPQNCNKDCRYLCFTDNPQDSYAWETVIQQRLMTTPVLDARLRKILAHEFIDTKYSIWLDSNLRLSIDPVCLITDYLSSHDIALFEHCERDCIYQEAEANIFLDKAPTKDIYKQVGRYRLEGYPNHNGLVETSLLIRRHTPEVCEFNESWWKEILRSTHRDQLSFNVICWRLGIEYKSIEGNFRYGGTSWLNYRIGHKGK